MRPIGEYLVKTSWKWFLLILACTALVSATTSRDSYADMNEHEEAGLLVKRLKTELGLRQGQKIFFRPHWMHIELFVYGIVDPNEQEKFIVLMKKIHRDTATRKFDVTFYPPEKFEERRLDNKTITRKRILQQPLRTVRFE